MQIMRVVFWTAVLAFLLFPPRSEAYWIWSPAEGKFVSPETAAASQKTAEEQYHLALQLRETGETEKAIGVLQSLVRQYPKSAYAPESQFLLAELFEQQGKPARAAQEFQKLIREHSASPRLDEAVERLYKIGSLFLTGEKEKVMGVAVVPVLPKAVEVFNFIVEHAPYGPFGDQAELQLGTACRKMARYEEAVKAFEALIENYPDSSLIDEAHYQLAETSYDLAQQKSRDEQVVSQAAANLKSFIQEYEASPLVERAEALKRVLDNQDAEKNYRIALYYEKQGFIESALIYYEDTASRYAETDFGKKAGERFQALSEPARAISEGEEAIARRLAEVRSMISALSREEGREQAGQKALIETAPLKEELESERTSLELALRQFYAKTEGDFRDKREGLKKRERNLKEKFRNFEKRRKQLKGIPSPELAHVFQNWEESLVKEQSELAELRASLEGMKSVPRIELKKEKRTKRARKPAALEEKRLALDAQVSELSQKEFEWARANAFFGEPIPEPLREKQAKLASERNRLDEISSAFDEQKRQYQTRFQADFVIPPASDGSAGLNLRYVAGGESQQELENLKKEKAALAEAWLAQTEKVHTISKAFTKAGTGIPQISAAGALNSPASTVASLQGEERAKAIRILKKRMKFLEREIRKRLDQIQDWEQENAERMAGLNKLLHPAADSGAVSKAAGAVTAPVTGVVKLTRSFLFGLPKRDRELAEEARETVERAASDTTNERVAAIRELREEIELQSILIQGRAQEVSELRNELIKLEDESAAFPDFKFQTMLIERYPSSLEHSLVSARDLLGEERSEAVFERRLSGEQEELKRLTSALNEVDGKIEELAQAIEQAKQSKLEPAVTDAQPGDAETAPALPAANPEKVKMQSELNRVAEELRSGEAKLKEATQEFDRSLFDWYHREVREKLTPSQRGQGAA